MSYSFEHLIVVPIVLPLVSAALMLLLDERRRSLRAAINVVSTLILLGVAVALLRFADTATTNGGGSVGVYLLGNWSAPFGIVLVVDRLSALMLVLTSILALAALLFSIARWHRVGVHFHVLVQFLLLGSERRLPDRRSVQPVRLLRGVAGGILRSGSAWFRAPCGSKRACTTLRSIWPPPRFS